SALLYHEHRDGAERLRSYLRHVAASAVLPSGGEPVPLARGSDLQSGPALLYATAKGAYVLHMLRQRIGDDAFFKLLRSWAGRRRFGRASTADFVAFATETAGAETLAGFFEQWVRGASVPDPSVQFSTSPAADGGQHVRGVVSGLPLGFRSPIDL